MTNPNSYKFVSALLFIVLIIVVIFLFKSSPKDWKEEKIKIEEENKKLDKQIKIYQLQNDSLIQVVENRKREIEIKDSLILKTEIDLSNLKRKYDKIYSSLDKLTATDQYELFTKYTDTIQ